MSFVSVRLIDISSGLLVGIAASFFGAYCFVAAGACLRVLLQHLQTLFKEAASSSFWGGPCPVVKTTSFWRLFSPHCWKKLYQQVPPASASYRLSDVDDCLSCNKDYSLVNDNKESAKLLMDADESLSFHLTAMKRSRGSAGNSGYCYKLQRRDSGASAISETEIGSFIGCISPDTMCLPETHRLAHAVTTSSAVDDEVEATDGIDFHHPRNRLSIWLDNLEKERTRRDYRQPVSGGTKCRSPCDIFDRATTDEATQVKVVQRTTHHLVEEVEDQAWLMEIMAVDKDEAQLMILKKIFKGMLFVQLTHAGSAEEALSLLADRYDNKGSVISSFPALVVMDMDTVVTGMSGLDATRKIRKFYPDIPLPIILSTAKDDFETLRLCFEAGGNDLITKPFTSDVLMARISAQLGLLDRWSNQLSLQRKVQLLHDILPEEVVERLSHGEHMVSEELEEVSIVFTDIVGYTSLASSVHTVSLMAMLHQLFRSFDQLTEKHRVYKVETIGDAYMVVVGHNDDTREDHAVRALHMAADMLAAASKIAMPNGSGPLQIRAGVHSGPAHAGVVGCKRPRFCLFGDTVNVASRMESTSFPQCVHISSATHFCYQMQAAASLEYGHHRYGFVYMGKRQVKGKGEMSTWLVQTGAWRQEHQARASLLLM